MLDDPGQDRVVAYIFPTPGLAAGLAPYEPQAVSARTGFYCFDTTTALGRGTWRAARAAVDCALTAADLVLAGEPAAYACCRPPGHHVTRTAYGGLLPEQRRSRRAAPTNARRPRRGRRRRRASGNGTQQVFYEDDSVLTCSVHVDPAAGWFPHRQASPRNARGTGRRRQRQCPARPWLAGRDLARGDRTDPRRGKGARLRGPRRPARGRRRSRRPREPARGHGRRLSRSRAPARPRFAFRPSSCRRADTISPPSAASSSPHWRGSRRECVPEPVESWIGKEEFGGVPTPTRRDAPTTSQWTLEAIAATERARPRALAGRRPHRVHPDRDTSDVWLLDQAKREVMRMTTRRELQPYWEDTAPAVSPDGSQIAYGDEGAVWLVPVAGGPPRKLVEADSPVWLDERRLIVVIERDDRYRLASSASTTPGPSSSFAPPASSTSSATRVTRPSRPTARRSRSRFAPRRSQPHRDPRRLRRDGRGTRAHGCRRRARSRARVGARRERHRVHRPARRVVRASYGRYAQR